MSENTKVDKRYISPLIYTICRPLLKFVFYVVFWPKIKGKENIPKKGGAVLAGNHVFVLDPFCVGSGTRRCVHFLGKYEIFPSLSLLNSINTLFQISTHLSSSVSNTSGISSSDLK